MIDKTKALETLELAVRWLNNIETQHGLDLLMDACPNNWGGRFDLQSLMIEIEQASEKCYLDKDGSCQGELHQCSTCQRWVCHYHSRTIPNGVMCVGCGYERYLKGWLEQDKGDHNHD